MICASTLAWGEADSIRSAEILWPSGKDDTYKVLVPQFIETAVEGSGVAEPAPSARKVTHAKTENPAEPASRR
jgi:hypothetical protein